MAGILGAVVAAVVLAVHDPGTIGIGLLWEALFGTAIALPTTCVALPLTDLYVRRSSSGSLLLPTAGFISGFLTTLILVVPAFVIAGSLAGTVGGVLFDPLRRTLDRVQTQAGALRMQPGGR